jgi:acetamidase/formamidase
MLYAETADYLITMGFDEDMRQAMEAAHRIATRMIVERTRLTSVQAYSLCSMAANVRRTQVILPLMAKIDNLSLLGVR